MQRFTELLSLLVACTLPLLFVNGLEALQPAIKNSLQTYAIIRGLLVPRQFFCNSGFVCESSFCCNVNWHCCVGSCDLLHLLSSIVELKFCRWQLLPTSVSSFGFQVSIVLSRSFYRTYCVLGTNGVVGCCPNGELCSGPAPTDNNPPPPPPPLPPPPPVTTTQRELMTLSSYNALIYDLIAAPTSISSSTSTTTLTSLIGGPTQSAENQIIEVSVVDVNVNWSENWVLQTSSCDPSVQSKITTTANSFFTYMSNDIGMLCGLFLDCGTHICSYSQHFQFILLLY